MEHSENQIILRGSLQDLPQFSHENHHKRFFRFDLCVPRLSGAEDILPVIASEKVLSQMDLSGGTMLRIEGQIRGIRGMVERDAYCTDILTQVAAASAALNGFSKELLSNHIKTCVAQDIRDGKDETIDELVMTLQKLMK